ncbi:MAG TPA: hypothetical protein VIH57_17925 [Bacteroidales bacterium]
MKRIKLISFALFFVTLTGACGQQRDDSLAGVAKRGTELVI